MSKIFFDHLIEIDELRIHIDRVSENHDEKEDLWNLVDEYINQKIISSILSELDEDVHEEFILRFLDKPYDTKIIDYLNTKLSTPLNSLISANVCGIIKELNEIFEIQPEVHKPAKATKKINKK